jgi:hypothetical protein
LEQLEAQQFKKVYLDLNNEYVYESYDGIFYKKLENYYTSVDTSNYKNTSETDKIKDLEDRLALAEQALLDVMLMGVDTNV